MKLTQIRKEKKYDVSFNAEITRVNSKSSINTGAQANYWQGNLNADIEITLPFKFIVKTELNYKTKQKDPRFPSKNQFTLWNASLKRFVFKEALEASVSVNH